MIRRQTTTAEVDVSVQGGGRHVITNTPIHTEILPPKSENFQIKILIFFIFLLKTRLWVLVRTTSPKRF